MRERTHRRPWESHWRSGRTESCKFPEDATSSSGTSASWWWPLGHRDVGEPRRCTSDLSSRGGSSHDPHLPTLATMSPFTHGPYPTVRPLPSELRRSDTSVPGLMQDIGSLHVANLVAGDILTSGDESSRPPTALDDVGTPREPSSMFKPRYLSLDGSGLDVPWIITPPSPPPPPPPPPRIGETAPLIHNRWKERLERPSMKPDESSDPPSGAIETWRDSLRNNIANALGVFASPAHAPTRPSVTAYDWQHTTPPAVGRAASTASVTSRPWTLEETREGAGIVHIRGVPDPPSIPSPSSTGTRPPTTLTALRSPRSPPPRASIVPPYLPHLPPPPQVPRTSRARSTSTKRQHGSRRRRSVVQRESSSASSATSVGSEMSRVSGGTRWSQLSDKEEAARRALRQRRLQSVNSARKGHGSSGPVT